MERKNPKHGTDVLTRTKGDVPGIVIADGGLGLRNAGLMPRVRAFVYGEQMPASPTLPFGRWKAAS